MKLEPFEAPVTVADLYDRFAPIIWDRVAENTRGSYERAWKLRVGPVFADMDVAWVRPLDVEAAFAGWSGSPSTRVDALALLSRLCGFAVKGGHIPSNPCKGVDVRRRTGGDPASRALSRAQVDVLLAELDRVPAVYRRFVLAMLYTGCRLGEIAGLRVADVDHSGLVIWVRRTASPGLRGVMRVGETKGRRVRPVPLAAPLVQIVADAAEGKGAHDLLFPGPRGGVLSSGNLTRGVDWPSLRDRIKTFGPGEPPLHWHDLRHTAAVVLFRAGESAPNVQAILGHSSLAVTQLYANTRDEAARHAAASLSAYYGTGIAHQGEGNYFA